MHSHRRRAARATPPSGCLTAEDGSGLDALWGVLAVYEPEQLLGPGQLRVADRALRSAVRRLAAEARRHDPVRAERLVVALRRAWQAMPAVQRLPDEPRRALWDRVVRLCCEEFYAPVRSASASPNADAVPVS